MKMVSTVTGLRSAIRMGPPFRSYGYYLTDDAGNLTKWAFPDVTLAPGGFLVVIAVRQ